MVSTVTLSLEEFLQQPETKSASEYVNGQIYQKPMPQGKHRIIQTRLAAAINQRAVSTQTAHAFTELRCTVGGRSIVPDIAVFEWSRIPLNQNGEVEQRPITLTSVRSRAGGFALRYRRSSISDAAMTARRLIQLVGAIVLSCWMLMIQPAGATGVVGQNAKREPVEDATDSNLSGIPNLEKVDYDTFKEQFGDVPGEHVPLINPDNEKVQLKTKTSEGEKAVTTEDLKRN